MHQNGLVAAMQFCAISGNIRPSFIAAPAMYAWRESGIVLFQISREKLLYSHGILNCIIYRLGALGVVAQMACLLEIAGAGSVVTAIDCIEHGFDKNRIHSGLDICANPHEIECCPNVARFF